jgi:hypothetical protein
MAEIKMMSDTEYGHAIGYKPGQTIYGAELAEFRRRYAAYQKQVHESYIESQGGGWRPTSVPVTNAVTGEVVAAFMSSPKSATIMPVQGAGTSRMGEITNAVGNYAEEQPQQQASIWDRIFGGVQSAPAPQAPAPQMAPSAEPAPAEVEAAPAAAGEPAPTPVPAPTPGTFSREQFKQLTGQDLAPGIYQDAQNRPFVIQ